jgi:hypothetical protein
MSFRPEMSASRANAAPAPVRPADAAFVTMEVTPTIAFDEDYGAGAQSARRERRGRLSGRDKGRHHHKAKECLHVCLLSLNAPQ